MLDQPASPARARLQGRRPHRDFQDHLADLEANGLLVRIERPINKDTELHPLVRWQFLGGVPQPAPGPADCGSDPTADKDDRGNPADLGCAGYPKC